VKRQLVELSVRASMPPEAPAEPQAAFGRTPGERISTFAIQIELIEE